jgi:hypothetical protein
VQKGTRYCIMRKTTIARDPLSFYEERIRTTEYVLQQCYEVDGRCYAVPGVPPILRAESRAELQDRALDLLIPFANGETVDYEQVQ